MFQKQLLNWFRKSQRDLPWRRTKKPYRIWVAEVMLQQTQVKKVIDYYNNFIEKFPDIYSLAASNLQDVLKAWEGMGYYARARNLHKAARILVQEYDSEFPESYTEVKKLPGIGDYIAGAVVSQAFGQPYAVVDGNVKRVLARMFVIDDPINLSSSHKIFKEYADQLLDRQDPGIFNQAMMELGATVCRPKNPSCQICPVSCCCESYKKHVQSKLPVAIRDKKTPTYQIAVGIIRKNNLILITQRKLEGLLGGLWEFPGGRVNPGESSRRACIRQIRYKLNLNVAVSKYLTKIHHAYSHFKIEVNVYDCQYQSGKISLKGPVDYRWITIEQINNFPIHAAHHKFIPLIK